MPRMLEGVTLSRNGPIITRRNVPDDNENNNENNYNNNSNSASSLSGSTIVASRSSSDNHNTVESRGPDKSQSQTPESPSQNEDSERRVRQRISRACDHCNSSRRKCDGRRPCGHCLRKSEYRLYVWLTLFPLPVDILLHFLEFETLYSPIFSPCLARYL
jgi:hypothetical protein